MNNNLLNNNINYDYITSKINKYTFNKIKEINSIYGSLIKNDLRKFFVYCELNNKIVIVNKPNKKDNEIFKNNIPYIHGGNIKNDNYIHIYPYLYGYINDDKILEKYIDNFSITHQLFHYIFKLDFSNFINDKEFTNFINEGVVQYYSEIFEGKKFINTKYRKNVDLAKKFVKRLKDNKTIYELFENKFSDKSIEIINDIYKEYKIISEFNFRIENIVENMCNNTNIKYNSQEIKNVLLRLSVEDSIDIFRTSINHYLDEDNKVLFNEMIDNLEKNYRL